MIIQAWDWPSGLHHIFRLQIDIFIIHTIMCLIIIMQQYWEQYNIEKILSLTSPWLCRINVNKFYFEFCEFNYFPQSFKLWLWVLQTPMSPAQSWPIRGEYSGHVDIFNQSEASIRVTWQVLTNQRPVFASRDKK